VGAPVDEPAHLVAEFLAGLLTTGAHVSDH